MSSPAWPCSLARPKPLAHSRCQVEPDARRRQPPRRSGPESLSAAATGNSGGTKFSDRIASDFSWTHALSSGPPAIARAEALGVHGRAPVPAATASALAGRQGEHPPVDDQLISIASAAVRALGLVVPRSVPPAEHVEEIGSSTGRGAPPARRVESAAPPCSATGGAPVTGAASRRPAPARPDPLRERRHVLSPDGAQGPPIPRPPAARAPPRRPPRARRLRRRGS